jgi:hypothetical protein
VADYYSALTADLMAGVMTLSDADAGMREARKVLSTWQAAACSHCIPEV